MANFNASFFEISGTDVVPMDPNQSQMLEVVFEGLENTRFTLECLSRASVACLVGSFATGVFTLLLGCCVKREGGLHGELFHLLPLSRRL